MSYEKQPYFQLCVNAFFRWFNDFANGLSVSFARWQRGEQTGWGGCCLQSTVSFGLCADISPHWCHWCSVDGTTDVLGGFLITRCRAFLSGLLVWEPTSASLKYRGFNSSSLKLWSFFWRNWRRWSDVPPLRGRRGLDFILRPYFEQASKNALRVNRKEHLILLVECQTGINPSYTQPAG